MAGEGVFVDGSSMFLLHLVKQFWLMKELRQLWRNGLCKAGHKGTSDKIVETFVCRQVPMDTDRCRNSALSIGFLSGLSNDSSKTYERHKIEA